MWYSWPGNVRELENLCERITLTCSGSRVEAACLPAAMLEAGSEARKIEATQEPAPAVHLPAKDALTPLSLDDRLHELEVNLISWALRVTGGNKSHAAQLLKIKRSTLSDRINRCGLSVPQVPEEPQKLHAIA
ncbi:MAG: hypothetical protein EHM55_04485 [Acidobacteria bacterium]|nr:MAG: hypothetical protein EHM55_04485 [Acidobacteriota bacterium]